MFDRSIIRERVIFTASRTGLREMPSAALCFIPRTWTILNHYLNVFSFKFLGLGCLQGTDRHKASEVACGLPLL